MGVRRLFDCRSCSRGRLPRMIRVPSFGVKLHSVSVSVALLLPVFGSVTPLGAVDRGGIRDRTGCGSADCAGSFVGNLTRRRHGNGIIDIATAARGEAGRTATLSSGIGHTGEDAWEGIVDDDACRTGAKRGER